MKPRVHSNVQPIIYINLNKAETNERAPSVQSNHGLNSQPIMCCWLIRCTTTLITMPLPHITIHKWISELKAKTKCFITNELIFEEFP